jgi:hypothetical protein
MSHFRVIRVSLAVLLVCAFPLIASAATTDFRILFDVDHDIATGCTVSTMPGVDQVFTTRVDTTASTAGVTQTFRQVCTGNSLGPQILIENLGWPAGFQSSSGQLLVETRIPFSSFPEPATPRNMRIGLVGIQGSTVHTAVTRPNGDLVFFPAPARGRRRAVAAPGGPRLITLDGIGTDWNGLNAMFDGIGASGVPGLRIEKFFGFADTNLNLLYFRFDVNLSTSAPFAANDFYTRAIGEGLTVPGVNGDPTVLENDTDPNGLPLTATLVSQPADGQVVLGSTGGFTYTPNDPNADSEDTFEYRASNGAQDSNVATVTIAAQEVEVSGPNQEPSFNKGSDPLVLEDAGPQVLTNWATNVTAGADEDDDQTVTFVITNVTNPEFFDDPPTIAANGTLTFAPAANAYGISTVTVKIIDDGGTADGGDNESPTQNFFITIDPVNDQPSFTPGVSVVVEDNDGPQTRPAWATGMSSGPANESGQLRNWVLGNDNPALFTVQPSIATNGTLTFTPAVGQTGIANITVQLQDDGGTANGGVDISAGALLVITVEKSPVITSANNTTFTVGQAGTFTVTTTGIPRPSIAIGGVALPAGITFVEGTGANKGTGTLSGTPAPGTGGTYALTFTATNVRGSSPTQNFTLTVRQAPAITSANTATFTRNVNGSFNITTTGFPTPALSLTGTLPTGLTFTDNGNGTATINGTPTVGGSFPGFTVTASNGVGANANQALTIVVNDVPVITSANSTGFAAGVAANFTVTTTGFPTPSLSETGALPAGITFTNNGNGTATLGGTAIEGSGGVYTITINATNVVGTTPQTFTITVCNTIVVTNPVTTTGTVGAPFSQNFTQLGAVGSATFTTASTLPAGLTLSTAGVLSGTPTQLGTFPIVVTVTDVNGCTGTGGTYSLVIGCQTITVNNPVNANGTAGSAFSETFTQTSAIGGATFTLGSGTLPAGLTLATNGVLSGTPTQTGSFPITVTVTDGNGCTGTSAPYTLVIACQTITVTNPANSNGTAGSAFSETFTQTGAIGGATFTTASTLPAGLTLATNGVLSGTPTQTGSFPITVTVTDANGCTGTSAIYTLVIACQTITVNNPPGSAGTAGASFNQTFTQTGGIGPVTFNTASTLPTGMTFTDNGNGTATLSGTPTQTGTFPISVTVTDSNGCTGTNATYNLVIGCQTITVTNPSNSNATVNSPVFEPFSQTGAIGTVTYTLASGTLPAGLTLNANGTISGSPTQTGSFPITVTATDANGCTGTSPLYTLVVACQTITVTNPANANGTAGTAFSETFTQTGAVGSATFATASTLPAGITLATNGVLSGTPTQFGSFPITVTVTDANGCTGTGGPYNLVIVCPTITVINPVNTAGVVGTAFSETFTQTGAAGSATFTTASTLPAGITLATNGVLSGTPTQFGTFPIVVTVTDANGCTGTSATYNLVISCQTITVTNPANANGTAGSAFSETFTQVGALGGATFTPASTLPAGLTLATNGVLSGTPTQTGTFPIVVTVTDGNGCTGTSATYNLVIGCQTITVTSPANANGTAGSPFSETFTQTGGIPPVTFTVNGTLPAGLTLATNGVLSGTPTQTGSFPITVTATDVNGCTGTSATYTLVIGCQTITVTNPANTNGTAGAAFSETFTQTGTIGTATFTTASTLPTGITLATNGVLSGTPTQTGLFPIVVTVTDSNGCIGTSSTYNLVIGCQTITVTNPANTNGTVSSPFSETFTQTGAIGGATFTTASTLPAGITLATNGVLSGTPTQSGTFPIVVTVTDGNGCTGTSPTYTLVIACQVITVTNPANATGPAGSPFSETFIQAGAIGTALFTTASTLPTGLTLSTAGVLSGTPTQGGIFPIVVTVTDSNGCTGTGTTYNLNITCPVITVTNPANANGTASSPFSETFTQTGAIGGATFTLNSGTLPTGLSLAANGVLSGTPTQTGSFPITVKVTDGNGCTGTSATYNLVIGCQTINVTNPVNTAGTANAAFSETFTQTGAIGTATFTTASTLPAGLTLSTAGVLSGTPTQTGCFPIVVTVTDSNGCIGTSSTYTICIACQTIAVTNPANSTGTILVPFSETFTQTGAIGTATFTTASTLPAGLTLSTAGVLSGTPTQTGSFPITVTVTDSNGCTGTSALYTIVINCQTITVTNPGNGTGTVNAPFSETFTQSGANGGATFTLNSGTLPNGLSLAANGVLSGIPTQTGSFPITVLVTDGNSCTGVSTTYTIVIGCQSIAVTNPSNATGTVGSPFSETFTQVGAFGSATFTTASTLPTGLTLSSAGVLSGTPTQNGSFPIVVTVTDGNGCTGLGGTYTLVLSCQTINVTNPGISTGTVSSAFSQVFTQTGAIGTASFTTVSTLPAGLTLATNGTLSGVPTQSGTFPIVVTVTDSNGCTGTGATYTLIIACQTITVTNPANVNGTAGVAFSETFTQTGGIGTTTFTVTSGTLPNGLTLSSAGVLSGTPTQNGTFPIVVTATDSNTCTGVGATYNLVIACAPFTFTPLNTMPAATYGVAYSQNISITGGTGPYTLTLANATTVPASFTFTDNTNGSATIASAGPTVTGVFTFDVNVLDTASNCTQTQTFSLTVAPNAQNDNYGTPGAEAVGNTQVVVGGHSAPTTPFVAFAGSIIGNDQPAGVTVTAGTFATAQGGSITLSADGKFTYTPAVGIVGDDTFIYTIISNGVTDSATITIKLANRVWYVKNDFGNTGDGRSHLPFDTLVEAQNASIAGEIIYVMRGDGTTSNQNAGIVLKATQQLIGSGAALTVNTHSLAIAGLVPLIGNTGGPGVTLADGNILSGFNVTTTVGATLAGISGNALTTGPTLNTVNIGPTTGAGLNLTASAPAMTTSLTTVAITGAATTGINANAFGTLTINSGVSVAGVSALALNTGAVNGTFTNVSSTGGTNGVSFTAITGTVNASAGTMSGATGATFNVNGGTLSSTWQGILTQANNAALVSIANHGTGTITFNTAAIGSTNGTGLQFSAATGTYNFNGATTLNGGSAGVNIAGASNGTFVFGTGVQIGNVTSPTGAAFTVNGSNPSVTYSGNISQTNAADTVNITSQASGNITFQTGTITSTNGSGLVLSNADGTVNFNGTSNLTGTNGVRIVAGTGGTITFGANTAIGAAVIPFVLDGTGAGNAVNGNITYNGTINKAGTGTLLSINTLSGSLAFNGSTLTGTTGGAPGIVSTIANITGTLTANHLSLTSSNNNFNGTLVAISGTNTGGTMTFNHLVLSAPGSNHTGLGLTATGGGTLNVTATGGASSIDASNTALSLNGQALNGTFGSIISTGGTNGIALTTVSGSLTIGGGSLSLATGATFLVSGGTVSVTDAGTIAQAAAQPVVSVSGGHATGTLTFNGAVTATNGTGLQFDNADGTYNFNSATTSMNGGDAGVDILNGSAGSFTFPAAMVITNPTGIAFNVTDSNPALLDYNGTITGNNNRAVNVSRAAVGACGTIQFDGAVSSSGAAAQGIRVLNCNAGTISFSANVTLSTQTNTALTLNTNAGATMNFSNGNLTITTTNGNGIAATGGGTVNITGNDNTINTTGSGSAVNWAMLTGSHSAGTLRFKTINKSGSGAKGIVVNYHDGSFTVTGDDDNNGSPDSLTAGGAITGTSARGAEFVDVDGGVSLNGMTFTSATTADGAPVADCGNALETSAVKTCNAPIYFDTVANASLRLVTVTNSVQNGIIGYDVTGLTMETVIVENGGDNIAEDGGAAFKNLRGSSSISNSIFRNNTRAQFDITNNSGTNATGVTFLNNEFTGNRAPNLSAQGLLIINGGSLGTVNIGDGTVGNDNNFHDSFSNGLQYAGNAGGSSATLNINENTFTNVNSGVVLQVAGVGAVSSLNYTIENNTVVAGALTGSGAIITSATQGHGLTGMIRNNIIGTSGVANSGAVCNSCNGISVDHDGFGRHDVSIIGNTVQRVKSVGIYYQVADASANVVITGNLVREPEGNPASGIYVQSGTVAADNGCVAVTLGGTINGPFPSTSANQMNSVQGAWDPAGFQSEIMLFRRFATVMNLPGLAGAADAWVAARNSIPDGTGPDVTAVNNPFGSAASCP